MKAEHPPLYHDHTTEIERFAAVAAFPPSRLIAKSESPTRFRSTALHTDIADLFRFADRRRYELMDGKGLASRTKNRRYGVRTPPDSCFPRALYCRIGSGPLYRRSVTPREILVERWHSAHCLSIYLAPIRAWERSRRASISCRLKTSPHRKAFAAGLRFTILLANAPCPVVSTLDPDFAPLQTRS